MRALAPLLLLPLLAGCGSAEFDYLTSFGSPARPAARPAAIARATPAGAQPAEAPPDPFCLGVAKNDAATSGFDQPTQGKVAIRSYQQCVGLFGAQAGK